MMLTRRSSISPILQAAPINACATSGVVATVADVFAIADGTYDVVIIEARETGEDALILELVITSGAHRGEVVRVHAHSLGVMWVDLLGTPATLTVSEGRPRVSLP
jgi:hypothetical protein